MISAKGFLASTSRLEPKIASGVAILPQPALKPAIPRGSLISRQESIKALLRTLSARDPYTGHHSNRVTTIALTFARSLGLSSQELESLTNAGYLHDIGKIGINDAILLKPGPLTPAERSLIQNHPLIGEKIVEPLGLSLPERNLILLHHEHWNG